MLCSSPRATSSPFNLIERLGHTTSPPRTDETELMKALWANQSLKRNVCPFILVAVSYGAVKVVNKAKRGYTIPMLAMVSGLPSLGNSYPLDDQVIICFTVVQASQQFLYMFDLRIIITINTHQHNFLTAIPNKKGVQASHMT